MAPLHYIFCHRQFRLSPTKNQPIFACSVHLTSRDAVGEGGAVRRKRLWCAYHICKEVAVNIFPRLLGWRILNVRRCSAFCVFNCSWNNFSNTTDDYAIDTHTTQHDRGRQSGWTANSDQPKQTRTTTTRPTSVARRKEWLFSCANFNL